MCSKALTYNAVFLLLALCVGCGKASRAQRDSSNLSSCPLENTTEATFESNVLPTVNKYCTGCHGESSPAAGISFVKGVEQPKLLNDVWEMAFERVSAGVMPPPPAEGPNPCEMKAWKKWIEQRRASIKLNQDEVSEYHLTRLSKEEYTNALLDLFGSAFVDQNRYLIDQFPEDEVSKGFKNLTWSLSVDHVNVFRQVAVAAGDWITSSESTLNQVFTCEVGTVVYRDCFFQTLDAWGRRILRRPLLGTEIEIIKKIYGDGDTARLSAIRKAFLYLLQAPQFIYKLEVMGTTANTSSSMLLTDFEIASRISFFAWKSIPDDKLLEAAAAGKLRTAEGLSQEIARVFHDPRARKNVVNFFMQWLHISEKAQVSYTPEFLKDLSPIDLSDGLYQEFSSFIDSVVFEKNSNLAGILNSRVARIPNASVAKLYGLPADSNLGSEVNLPSETRAGLFTRAAVIATGSDQSLPIHRGASLLSRALCENLLAPDKSKFPPDTFEAPLPKVGTSTRQIWEQKTSPSSCQMCHSRINPLGFIFENYDGIGRFRRTEDVPGDTPNARKQLAIDSSARAIFDLDGSTVISGPIELSKFLSQSEKFKACMTASLWRYFMERAEQQSDYGAISEITQRMSAKDGSFLDALMSIPKLKSFIYRALSK